MSQLQGLTMSHPDSQQRASAHQRITTPTTFFTHGGGHFTILGQGGFALGEVVLSAPDCFLAIHMFGNRLQENVIHDFSRD